MTRLHVVLVMSLSVVSAALPQTASLNSRLMRVSQLNNHWAVPGRGAVLVYDCTPLYSVTTGVTAALPLRPINPGSSLVGTVRAASTNKASWQFGITDRGCMWTGQGTSGTGGSNSYVPPSWATDPIFQLGNKYSLSTSFRAMANVNNYVIGSGSTQQVAIISDFTANTIELTGSAWQVTSPRLFSGLVMPRHGKFALYSYRYASEIVSGAPGVGQFGKSLDGAAFTISAIASNGINSGGIVLGSNTTAAFPTGSGHISWFGVWIGTGAPWRSQEVYAAQRATNKIMRATGRLATDYGGIVLFMGDQLTWGYNSQYAASSRYPNQAMSLLLVDKKLDWFNYGVNGSTVQYYSTNTAGISALCGTWGTTASGKSNITALWVGSNDAVLNSRTAAQMETNITTVVTALHTAGCKVVVLTAIPRGDATAGQITEMQNLNAWIVAGSSGADAVCDPVALPEFNDWANSPNNTIYYNADKINLTATGNGLIAGCVNTAVRSVW